MADQGEHEVAAALPTSVPPPAPPLPAKLNDLRPLLFVGSGAWFVAFCVVLVLDLTGSGISQVLWVTLAGWLLGGLGLAISAWQRAAARRGSRTAQTGI